MITDKCEDGFSGQACFEFYFQLIDTLVLVQNREGDVLIRASEETFSERKKENFIHELAMEGFIPDKYRWYQFGGPGIKWVCDRSWLKIDEVAAARTRVLMTRIAFAGALLSLLLIGICYRGPSAYAPTKAPAVLRASK